MFDFQFHGQIVIIFQRQWFSIVGQIAAFYRGLTRVCTPEQNGIANPEIVYYLHLGTIFYPEKKKLEWCTDIPFRTLALSLCIMSCLLQVFFIFRFRKNFLGALVHETAMYELTYRDSGNTIQFSFFAIQFFPPTQKIAIPKCKFCFVNR